MKTSSLYFALLVSSGGFLGTFLRFLVYNYSPLSSGHGLSTLFVNILGSALIGGAYAFSLSQLNHPYLVIVMTGVLGGFTTFSAFSLEALVLLREHKFPSAFFYIFFMLGLGLLACGLGFYLAKQFIK